MNATDIQGAAREVPRRADRAGRLQVKRKYDPANLFRVKQNIRPADV